jgi:4'-phosphopantetheinyl transferase
MFEVVILIVIPELAIAEYDALLLCVSSEKRERIKRFSFFEDARNCLMGDILARVEICRVTGLNNKQLDFAVNQYGKPFLTNNPLVHHNISHAGPYIACVISDEPVGIDIELIKPIDMKIAERFFTSDETMYILSAQDDIRRQRFFEVWTKKESRIKWAGKNLLKNLPSFSVSNSPEQYGFFYHRVYSNEEVMCYVCSNKEEPPGVRVIDLPTLLRHIKLSDKM